MGPAGRPQRDHQAATLFELRRQSRGHPGRRRGDQDGVKGGCLGPALVAVAAPDLHLAIPQVFEARRGLPGQIRADFDAEDLVGKFRQNRSLIPRTRPHLQHLITRRHSGPLGHQGHNIGLGDGLVLPDGQGVIAVGPGNQSRGHEAVTGHRTHGNQHPGVGDIPALQLPGHHGLPGVLETIRARSAPAPAPRLVPIMTPTRSVRRIARLILAAKSLSRSRMTCLHAAGLAKFLAIKGTPYLFSANKSQTPKEKEIFK